MATTRKTHHNASYAFARWVAFLPREIVNTNRASATGVHAASKNSCAQPSIAIRAVLAAPFPLLTLLSAETHLSLPARPPFGTHPIGPRDDWHLCAPNGSSCPQAVAYFRPLEHFERLAPGGIVFIHATQ